MTTGETATAFPPALGSRARRRSVGACADGGTAMRSEIDILMVSGWIDIGGCTVYTLKSVLLDWSNGDESVMIRARRAAGCALRSV